MAPVSVADYENRRTRLLSRQCPTCVFRPGNPMRLNPGRLRDLVGQCLADGSYLVCHATLPAMAPPGYAPAICRGFADQYDTIGLRLVRALWGFTLVDPPEMP